MTLESIVKQFESVIDHLPNNWCIMDNASRIVLANSTVIHAMGFDKNEQILGFSYADMRCEAANQADAYQSQDQLALNTRDNVDFLGYGHYNDGWKLLLGTKKPLIDENGETVGVMFTSRDIQHHRLVDLSSLLIRNNRYHNGIYNKQFSMQLSQDTAHMPYPLSQRLHECLFYFLRGKRAKEIGVLLNISSKTVESYIADLKLKFDTYTSSQLIEKSIALGYLNIIPRSLLRESTS